jgi:hypothetical protein
MDIQYLKGEKLPLCPAPFSISGKMKAGKFRKALNFTLIRKPSRQHDYGKIWKFLFLRKKKQPFVELAFLADFSDFSGFLL